MGAELSLHKAKRSYRGRPNCQGSDMLEAVRKNERYMNCGSDMDWNGKSSDKDDFAFIATLDNEYDDKAGVVSPRAFFFPVFFFPLPCSQVQR